MAEAPALALRPLNGPQDPCPQTQVVRTLYPLLKVQLTCLGSRQRFPKGRLCDTDRSRGSGKRTPLWTITCGQDCSPCLSPVKTHPACEQTKGSEKSLSKETCLTANKAFPKLFFFFSISHPAEYILGCRTQAGVFTTWPPVSSPKGPTLGSSHATSQPHLDVPISLPLSVCSLQGPAPGRGCPHFVFLPLCLCSSAQSLFCLWSEAIAPTWVVSELAALLCFCRSVGSVLPRPGGGGF